MRRTQQIISNIICKIERTCFWPLLMSKNDHDNVTVCVCKSFTCRDSIIALAFTSHVSVSATTLRTIIPYWNAIRVLSLTRLQTYCLTRARVAGRHHDTTATLRLAWTPVSTTTFVSYDIARLRALVQKFWSPPAERHNLDLPLSIAPRRSSALTATILSARSRMRAKHPIHNYYEQVCQVISKVTMSASTHIWTFHNRSLTGKREIRANI
jgi:hypothetical protein